jgi:hypothetical protein
MVYNEPLYNALKETEFLLEVPDDNLIKYRDHILSSFDSNMSYREILIYEKLGEYLSKGNKKLNVLDVGSGKLLTAEKLIKNTSFVNTYTAIDNKVDANDFAKNVKPYVETFEYHNLDILKDTFTSDTRYDIVFIDIEPHSHEIEVYENIKHVLSESHLCILKHVGSIDLDGSSLADKFLTKYEEQLSDYYGESSGYIISTLHQIRDVFVIFDTTKTTKIRELLIGDPIGFYLELDIKQFCRCSTVQKRR